MKRAAIKHLRQDRFSQPRAKRSAGGFCTKIRKSAREQSSAELRSDRAALRIRVLIEKT